MLTPSKHLDLDRSAIRVASEVLVELRRRRMMGYDAVIKLSSAEWGTMATLLLPPL